MFLFQERKMLCRLCFYGLFLWALLFGSATRSDAAEPVCAKIRPEKVLNSIDEKVYGHFLEHIYNSCNGGLWGELIWNRSFEATAGKNSEWRWSGGRLRQNGHEKNQRILLIPNDGSGPAEWTDYEMTLNAKKLDGREGFLLIFRAADDWSQYVWANLGGWGNRQNGFERGKGPSDRSPIGERIAVEPFEKDRVYKLRVRVEGDRYQVFCDDRPILDVTDPDGPKSGFAGLGTWETSAEFSDILVRDLNGKTLFEGAPALPVKSDVARFWSAAALSADGGDKSGAADVLSGDARNSDRFLEAKGSVLLRQNNIRFVQGERYDVSLWARGTGTVRFGIGRESNQTFPLNFDVKSGEWTRFSGTIQADMAFDGSVFLRLDPADGQTLDLDQVSMTPESWQKNGGFRPDLLQAIADLRPPVIRWPGGCYASAYRWKSGIGPQDDRVSFPLTLWNDVDVNSFGTDEFIDLCRRTGAEPILVVDIGTKQWTDMAGDKAKGVDWLGEVCQWVEYCNGPADSTWGKIRAANGHPEPYAVRYWEIDNEIAEKTTSAAEYIEILRELVPRMKAIDPSIKIIACGSWTGDKMKWDREIINGAGKIADYLSTHRYDEPDGFAVNSWENQRFFEDHRRMIAESPNPGIKIFDSEWNAQSTDWRTGLHAGGILNGFERVGDVLEIAAPALFLRHTSADGWDNALVNFDQTGWFPAPNYVVMKLWRDHYLPLRVEIDSTAAEMTGQNPAVNIVATRSADGKTLAVKAVNTLAEERTIEIALDAGGAAIRQADGKVVTPKLVDGQSASEKLSKRNTLDAPNAIQPEPLAVEANGDRARFVLPSYSAAVVRLTF